MTSGRWDPVTGRVRPGTYINVDGTASDSVQYGTRGIVLVPLADLGWGTDGSIVTVTKDNLAVYNPELGDAPMNILMVNEALKGAATVKAYIINKGTKASKTVGLQAASGDDPAINLVATAKCGGLKGNDLKIKSAVNTDNKFDVTVYLGSETVEEFTDLTTAADLIAAGSEYIDFTCTTPATALVAFASGSLTGGTAGTVSNTDITAMLDAVEGIVWNTMAFPFTDAALQTAAISKIEYLRDTIGKSVQAVLPNATTSAANYEGIINLINSVQLEDGTQLTVAQATAFVAAVTAGADETQSNTYASYPGADAIVGAKTNEEIETAIKNGQMCFTYDDEQLPHIEYDINSLHTYTEKRPKQYSKNKIIRIIDSLCDTIRSTYPPNRFPNNNIGWDRMDSLGKTILQHYDENGGNGAIMNVDYDNDFLVDRIKSSGDSVYVDVAITPVDAAEKLYFTVLTR